jgi:Transposase IS66 family
VHHRANRLEGDAFAQMAPSDTDHCARTESGIEYSRCGALDIRGGRPIGAAHPDSIGLHIDETEVKLRGCKGYVWVFASMDAVYFEYRDSRKAQFLGPLLEEFHGVLISDFFTGYDSLTCPQQKCLIPESGAFRGCRGSPEGLFITIPLRFCYSDTYLTFGEVSVGMRRSPRNLRIACNHAGSTHYVSPGFHGRIPQLLQGFPFRCRN